MVTYRGASSVICLVDGTEINVAGCERLREIIDQCGGTSAEVAGKLQPMFVVLHIESAYSNVRLSSAHFRLGSERRAAKPPIGPERLVE